jgi:hypothetical protein
MNKKRVRFCGRKSAQKELKRWLESTHDQNKSVGDYRVRRGLRHHEELAEIGGSGNHERHSAIPVVVAKQCIRFALRTV